MNYFDKKFSVSGQDAEEHAPAWETNNISQLVEAIKKRNATARRPQDKQKSRSRKKVNEVLSKLFDV